MLSKPLAAVQSTTSLSGVSGNGAVSRPSFIVRSSAAAGVAVAADDVDPAAHAGALGDGVVDEHLVVAVGERRDRSASADGPPGDHVGVDRPEEGAERVGEALDVPARQRRRGPVRAGPISAGFLSRISFGRSRWPSQIWSGCSESQAMAPPDPSISHWSEFFRPGLIWEMLTAPRAPLSKRSRIVAASSVAISRVDRVGRRARSRTSRPGRSARWRVCDERREVGHDARRSAGR